jgi:hypothetical protein
VERAAGAPPTVELGKIEEDVVIEIVDFRQEAAKVSDHTKMSRHLACWQASAETFRISQAAARR